MLTIIALRILGQDFGAKKLGQIKCNYDALANVRTGFWIAAQPVSRPLILVASSWSPVEEDFHGLAASDALATDAPKHIT